MSTATPPLPPTRLKLGDRLLYAQARTDKCVLLSIYRTLATYDVTGYAERS